MTKRGRSLGGSRHPRKGCIPLKREKMGSGTAALILETEQETLLRVFGELLAGPTGDGKKKRRAGLKPPWWRDGTHEPAIFSHLNKWKHGEKVDPDSGVHPLVHLAWRALAIAYQETFGLVNPGR